MGILIRVRVILGMWFNLDVVWSGVVMTKRHTPKLNSTNILKVDVGDLMRFGTPSMQRTSPRSNRKAKPRPRARAKKDFARHATNQATLRSIAGRQATAKTKEPATRNAARVGATEHVMSAACQTKVRGTARKKARAKATAMATGRQCP